MRCIVGLGNPESRYENTRHNVGFQIADRLAGTIGISFRKGKGEYLFAKGTFRRQQIVLIKPLTYMNRSGLAVIGAAQFYKIDFHDILVIMDDLDLPFGTLRFRKHGSDGGNKGLRSIIQETGTNEIPRLRIGIKNREKISNPSSYVLSKFNRNERKQLPILLDITEKSIQAWLTGGIDTAMNSYNGHHDLDNI